MKKAPKLKVIINDSKMFVTTFDIKTIKYQFTAQNLRGWVINFAPYSPSYKAPELDMKEIIQLFSAVRESLDLFIGTKDPEEFYFRPATPKLLKLYNRFAKKLAQIIPYTHTKDGSTHNFQKRAT